jgi:RNA polymerase sigma-70 factor (ECF subfamily)
VTVYTPASRSAQEFPANAMPMFPHPRVVAGSKSDRVRRALETHYDAIWRFLRRLGVPPADCEDAAQKVFIVFSERIGDIDPKSERSFLFASALRVASDTRKKKSYSHERLASDHEPIETHDPAPSADEQIDLRRQRAWLDEVLDSLSEEHRAVLVLVDIEEQTMADASDALGIPPGTVASRLRRARELFDAGANALKAKLDSAEKEATS